MMPQGYRRDDETISLTTDLCRLVDRPVPDPGPEASLPYYTDGEYAEAVAEALARFASEPVWVFGYGSLIWRPPVTFVERRAGLLRGWHRAFCLKTTRWRGTGETPGLMMALERGGSCRGMLLKIDPADAAKDLETIWRREIGVKPVNHIARHVAVRTEDGPVMALTFTANPAGRSYVGRLGVEATADILATAVGHWGSCADYLRQTVEELEAAGLRDRSLWLLQREVARRIRERHEAA
jgi:cation transport protein ChaC